MSVTQNYTALHTLDLLQYNVTALNNAFGRSYHWDDAGRLDAAGAGATQQIYHYDTYGQLASVDFQSVCNGGSAYDQTGGYVMHCDSLSSTTSFTYDSVGNRKDLGATYLPGNRLQNFSGGWYAYDADGNVSQKYMVQPNGHNQLFYWNPENRLDSLTYDGYTTVRYEYNAFGKPVKKYRKGVLDRVWLWDGDELLAEFDGNNQRVADYQYAALDQPYAADVGGTSQTGIQYHAQDALGNVIGTYNGGTVSQTISYDPWGMPTYSGDMSSRLMWKGLLWEGGPAQGDVVGLYYMRGRWYDPQAGRFIQEDPLGVDGSLNLYGFAGDDPVNGSDPSGADATEIGGWTDWPFSWPTFISMITHDPGGDPGPSDGGPTDQQPKPKKKPPAKCSPPATVAFVRAHNADATALGAEVGVPGSYILGLSAAETTWGTNRFALGGNFFSLHGRATSYPNAIGEMQAARDPSVYLPMFPNYRAAGEAFIGRYGPFIRGAATPDDFVDGLIRSGYNSGKASNGGSNTFRTTTVGGIAAVQRRMGC